MPKHTTAPRPSYLSAELLRSRGSALQWLPLLALPLVIMTIIFSSMASARTDATGVLAWQSLFVTGMYSPLTGLFAAIPERRETITRSGGTQWRNLNPRLENAARFIVVIVSLGVFHILNFGVSWFVVAAQGRENHELILVAGLYSFLGALGIAGLSAACARRLGFGLTLVAAALWQIISILPCTVESGRWWAFPPAWPQRLLLRALRIHQNSVPLEPQDPLLTSSPLPAFILCVILAVLGALAAVYTPRRYRPMFSLRHRFARSTTAQTDADVANTTMEEAQVWQPTRHPRAAAQSSLWSTLLGLHRAAFSPAVFSCLMLSILALGFVALQYPANYVEGFFHYFLLPVGAGILPVLVWPRVADSWPLVHMETRFGTSGILLWFLCVILAVCAAAYLASALAGGDVAAQLPAFPLTVGVGFAIAAVSLILVVRLGIVSAIALSIVGTIVSVTLGGDVLADTGLWILAFPAWPLVAYSSLRYAIAMTLTVVLCAAAALLARRLLHTRALSPR
ncbi:hypothetical protein ACUY2G_09140 [Corynebacterium guaraldiae]|uniref:hypothetical protein n=1 Tax=Corynebacterium sp. HMSC055A01 TaxID=1715083 RepID=UPI0008A25B73|nr:hypothetical protein [Corynebacterium sp. HMSC055A01]OFN15706.1 hypothetical protein HMPREF2604_13200 [Corynebacterium sp. HMSC055A01]